MSVNGWEVEGMRWLAIASALGLAIAQSRCKREENILNKLLIYFQLARLNRFKTKSRALLGMQSDTNIITSQTVDHGHIYIFIYSCILQS